MGAFADLVNKNDKNKKTTSSFKELLSTSDYNTQADLKKRIDVWFDEADRFNSNLNSEYKDNDYKSGSRAAGHYDNISKTADNLSYSARNIKIQLLKNKKVFGEDTVNSILNSIDSTLNNQQEIRKFTKQSADYWSQFENEDAYNAFKTQKEKDDKYAAMSVDDIQAEIDKLSRDKDQYMKEHGGKAFNWVAGIAQKVVDKTSGTDILGDLTSVDENNNTKDKYNSQINYLERIKHQKKSDEALSGLSEDTIKLLDEYNTIEYEKKNDEIARVIGGEIGGLTGGEHRTDEIIKELKEKGYDNYKALAEYRRYLTDAEAAEKEKEDTTEFTKKHPIIASAGTVALAPTKVLGFFEMLDSYDSEMDAPLNVNSPYFAGSRISSTARQTVMDSYDKKIKNFDVFDFVYGTGMSMLDSATAAALGGGSAAVAGAMIGSQVAMDTAIDITNRGGSKNKAIVGGFVSGVLESVFETISIGHFLKQTGVKNFLSVDGIKKTIKNIGKSSVVNASEETATEIANIIYDTLANGGASEYATLVKEYIAQGMSEDDAKAKATKDLSLQIIESGAGGALMGIGMGGIGTINGTIREGMNSKAVGKDIIDKGQLEALQSAAGKYDTNSEAYKLAQEISGVTSPTAKKVGELYNAALEQADAQMKSIAESAVKNRLNELGVNNADDLSGSILRAIAGERVRAAERSAIDSSTAAKRVINEYINAGTGEYSSDWAQKLNDEMRTLEKGYTKAGLIEGADAEGNVNENHIKATDSAMQMPETDISEYSINGENKTTVTVTGEEVSIEGIEGVSNGEVVVKLDNGKSMPIKNLSLPDDNATKLYAYASNYGTKAARRFVRDYPTGQNVDNYATKFNSLYQYGYNGLSFNSAREYVKSLNMDRGGVLDSDKQYQAYELGKSARRSESAKQQNKIDASRSSSAISIDSGKITQINKALNPKQIAAVKALKKISAVTGIDFVLFESEVDENGKRIGANGYYQDGKIHLDIEAGYNGEQAILRTASHELTHFIKDWSPAQYDKLQKYLLDTYMLKGDVTTEMLAFNQIKKAKNSKTNPRELTLEQALDEVVADACEMMLKDSNAIKELAAKNKTLADKIKQWIDDFAKAVARAFKGVGARSLEAQILEQYQLEMKEIQKIWDSALVDAVEARAAIKTKKDTAESGEVRYQLRGYTKDNVPVYESEFDKSVTANEKKKMFKERITTIFNLGAVKNKTNIKSIRTLADKYTIQKNVFGDFYSTKEEQSAKINSLYELADILSRSKFLKPEPEDSYIYNTIPKNKAHKDVKYWYKFQNTIVLDRDRFNVVFNIRDKGKEQYMYLIEFRKIDTVSQQSNTVEKNNLLRTEAKPSNTNISQNKNGVNNIISEKGENSTDLQSTAKKEKENTQFSMRDEVEQTKDLIAVHNLSEQKIIAALELGGFPMPSIAITRAREGHNEFGEISIVFGKDTIDPQILKSNKVYSGDAWTPTHPTIEYKANEKLQKKIKDKYYSLAHKFNYDEARPLYNYAMDLENELNRIGGESGLFEKLTNDTNLMQLFLLDSGKNKVDTVVKETKTSLSENEVKSYDYLISALGEDIVRAIDTPSGGNPITYKREFIEKYGKAIEKAYREMLADVYNYSEEKVENTISAMKKYDFKKAIIGANRYLKNGADTIRTEKDYKATEKAIRDTVNKEEYESWIKELFSNIVDKKGIRNEKDLYTPSGNRRNFEALHYEHTLENIVNAMKEQGDKGIGFLIDGNIFGAATTEYGSINDIKADAQNRMQQLPKSKYDEIKKGFSDRLFELANSLPIHKDSFTAFNDAANMLIEAVAKFKTKSGMANYLRSESKGWANYNDYIVDDLIQLVNEIRQMPVGYFEAKPQRVVYLEEVKAFIVPNNINHNVREALENTNANIIEYEADNTQDRIKALNSVENVKFSERDTNYKYEDKIAKLESVIEALKEEFELTNHKADRNAIRRMGRKVLREYASDYNLDKFVNEYEQLHNYVVNNMNDVVWEDVIGRAKKIADAVIEQAKTEIDEYDKKILLDLKTRKFRLSEKQKAEVVYRMGNMKEFTNAIMGNVRYTVDPMAMTLDEYWDELSDLYPAYFNNEVNDLDMPYELVQIIKSLREERSVHFGYEEEMKSELALRLFDEYFNVPEVKTFADKKQMQLQRAQAKYREQLDKHKEQIKKLKQSKREAVDDALQHGRQEIKKLREKKNSEYQEMAKKYQEAAKKKVERNKMTEVRNKIKKHILKLSNMLVHGTAEKHVPTSLYETVKELCEAVAVDYAVGQTIKDNLVTFADEYKLLELDGDYLHEIAYDEELYNAIQELRMELGDKTLSEYSLTELEKVYEIVRAVTKSVSNANKAFKAKKGETITTLGDAVSDELRNKKDNKQIKALGVPLPGKHSFWSTLKPVYAFKTMGSDTMTELYRNVRKGEDVWVRDVTEAKNMFLQCAKKYNFKNWDLEKTKEFRTENGRTVKFTVDEMMTLYIWNKRKQAALHLRIGGFVFKEAIEVSGNKLKGAIKAYGGAIKEPRQLVDSDFAIIERALTDDQKGFADEMQQYLAIDIGKKGNEISMAMYDIEKFRDKAYFPIRSESSFLYENKLAKSQAFADKKIKHASFTKELVPKAANPLVLEGFTDIWARHCNEMSLYHALALPLEDFNRVYNYRTKFRELVPSESIKALLKNKYGDGAIQYIEKLLIDINGGVRGFAERSKAIDGLIRKFKKNAVFASLSVMIQQPSAIGRATQLIDLKYFAKTVVAKRDWAELKKHAPIAAIKEMGYFDTHVGKRTIDWMLTKEYEGFPAKAKALFTDGEYRDELFSRMPAWMDEITWCHIWNAVKNETMSTTDLKPGSQEFFNKAAERFTEVIELTQVYDSVFSRSELMRSDDMLTKIATAFMAEPTTSFNMLFDAALRFNEGKAGKKFFLRTVGSYVLSVAINSMLKAIIIAARDDEEDKTFIEKYFGNVAGDMFSLWGPLNPLSLIPYVRDAISIFEGYRVERADMSIINNLWSATSGLFDEDKSISSKVLDMSNSLGAFLGVPVKNITRDIKATYNVMSGFLSDNVTTWSTIKYSVLEELGIYDGSKTDKLYHAIINNDKEQYRRITKDVANVDAMIRRGLAENDSRITEAAQARIDGDVDKYVSIAKKIIADGFKQDNVVVAVNTKMNAIVKEKAEGEKTEDTGDAEPDKNKVTSIYHYADLNASIENGDITTGKEIIDDMVRAGIENGKDENDIKSTIRSQVTKHWKPIYFESSITQRAEIRRKLYKTGLYGNLTDFDKTLKRWTEE